MQIKSQDRIDLPSKINRHTFREMYDPTVPHYYSVTSSTMDTIKEITSRFAYAASMDQKARKIKFRITVAAHEKHSEYSCKASIIMESQ
jgi:hypothetical protein